MDGIGSYGTGVRRDCHSLAKDQAHSMITTQMSLSWDFTRNYEIAFSNINPSPQSPKYSVEFNPSMAKPNSDPKRKKGSPPWGTWEVLLDESDYKVKRITVQPNQRLSYQTHAKRKEHWFVVRGKAVVTLDGKKRRLSMGDFLDIPIGSAHRIANSTNEALVFIEVQTGEYFGEDDIVRLKDDYGRSNP